MLKRFFAHKWYVLGIIGLFIAVPSISSYLTLLLQKIYNEVTVGTKIETIFRLVLTGVLIWLINRLLFYSQTMLKSKLICNIKQDLKHDIFINALNLHTSNLFQVGGSGEYISLFNNDITIIEQRFFTVLVDLISQLFSIVIVGSAFFSMNKKLAIYVIIFGIAVMFVPGIFKKRLNAANLSYSNKLADITQGLKEYFHSYSTIKNYAVEDIIIDKFDSKNSSTEMEKFRYDSSLALADGIGGLLTWFARMVVIGTGLIMVSRGEILLGTVMAAQSFAVELAMPMQGIVQDINSICSVKSIISKIEKMTTDNNSATSSNDEQLDRSLDNEDVAVSFQNFTVELNNRKIVNDFSFTFEPKKKYLIIGRNGSGKSSIFKSLKKQFGKYYGSVKLNDCELRDIPISRLSGLVAYLSESMSIFTGSVAENITLWRKISEGALTQAIDKAHLELPLERPVGEAGFNISSGEQRRIEIARSFVAPAKVLVFDEVVSTLDIETAYEIEDMVLAYQDKTVIFISHNFSGKLVKEYDEILLMENGQLLAHGSYHELIETSPYFRRLCEIKFGT